MPLTKEWLHRIKRWETTLWETCYRPLAVLSLTGFTTLDQLSPTQAYECNFTPMPPGTPWGAKWEYGWFKTELIVPSIAAGQRLVFTAAPALQEPYPGECLVWVNGKTFGSFGWARQFLTLCLSAVPATEYDILIEAYAGHGKLTTDGGPLPHNTIRMEEPALTQCAIGPTSFGIWRETIYQLAVDFTTLLDLHNCLDPLSLRVAEITQGLMDATLLVDPELPEAEYLVSAQLARDRLKPLLACTNGTTAPTLYAFGHAHIDVAWLWPLVETERKMARTVANQLSLIEEYPEYKFLQSQPQLYQMLHQRYPELYNRFKEAVTAGRVIADGAMWVEADTNLTSGESLIRQILAGKRFFQEEFDIETNILWLPDVFGYSGALPQILHGCGCTGFATQKITWAYHGGEPFPYNTFLWEGIDGTSIPAHIFTDYNSQTRPSALLERWRTRLQCNGINSLILAFGWGDGGGGPTRDHLEFLRRSTDLEGVPRTKLSSPAEFFANLPPRETLPRYVGELYFQAHRGTYTSQARTKQANRRLELTLREAEFWGCAARALSNYPFTRTSLQPIWRTLLLHQFHDILPGSSIQRVYAEAEKALSSASAAGESFIKHSAASLITDHGIQHNDQNAVTVFNSLSWPRTSILDLDGAWVEVTIPSCGWTTICQGSPALTMPAIDGLAYGDGTVSAARATPRMLENEFLCACFNDTGELVSLVEKSSNWEAMDGPGNRFSVYKDIPSAWDAWDIDSMAELQPLAITAQVTLELLDPGPLVAQLRLTRVISNSSITQVITLRRSSHRLEFATTVDWQESHKLLKVAFPVNIHAIEAIHEIQFGHLRRPTHRSRQFDADRFEVCNHKWSALADELHGVAVLNDSKYGLSVDGSTIKLTLLKSSIVPDPQADRGLQTFTFAVYPWKGPFAQSRLVQEGYELNIPPLILPGSAGEASLFQIDALNIILDTVKPAEDESPDLILRLYESLHAHTRCTLISSLPIVRAFQTNLLETENELLECDGGRITLDFRPFEIKTIRLTIANDSHRSLEVNIRL
jgi:alpha-mannosidase